MPETQATSYDEVPFSDNVLWYTHADNLASVATLAGMRPAPAGKCRVLDLGCGVGSNLIATACDLPQSRFLGIDFSARQIAEGNNLIAKLGLSNIELRAMSIMDVAPTLGEFDYIVCHGVYSWVPPEVQDKILAICNSNLAPDGVAYISYNTYPGWHLRGMMREMMGFHVRQFAEPGEQVAQGRALLEFLAKAAGGRGTIYGSLFHIELEQLQGTPDTYVYHEHLEEVNCPVYFHQFAERAAAKGLQYVSEAKPHSLDQKLPPDARQTLVDMSSSLIQFEQYLDFVRNRTFRRTLLCREQVKLSRPPAPEQMATLYLTGLARPMPGEAQGEPAGSEEFRTADGQSLTTNNPLVLSALHSLFDVWPASLRLDELWRRVQERGVGPDFNPSQLAQPMLQCYQSCMVELSSQPSQFVTEAGERPSASPLARLQAQAEGSVTNLRRRNAVLEPIDRYLLQYLDGSRDHGALVGLLEQAVGDGVLTVERQPQDPSADSRLTDALREQLEQSLHRLARSALLTQ